MGLWTNDDSSVRDREGCCGRSSLVSPTTGRIVIPMQHHFCALPLIHLHICCTALLVNNESMQTVVAVTVTDVLGKGSLPSEFRYNSGNVQFGVRDLL